MKKRQLILWALVVIFSLESLVPAIGSRPLMAAVTSKQAPAKPEINAQGMNLNAFGSVNSGAVDLSSGTFSFDQTDVSIPGRNGMNLTVQRTYNSKEFLSSPKWSKLDGDAFYNDSGESFEKAKWKAATPAQWGGWIGNGWKTNISGRLLYIKFDIAYFRSDWFGANTVQNDKITSEIVIIQTGSGSYSFEHSFKKDKNGVLYDDGAFIARDKGNKNKLVHSVAGFTLTLENGQQYEFREHYYTKSYDMHFNACTDLRSTYTNQDIHNVVMGNYLSYTQDTNGNRISYEYERGNSYSFNHWHKDIHEPFKENTWGRALTTCSEVFDYIDLCESIPKEAVGIYLQLVNQSTAKTSGAGDLPNTTPQQGGSGLNYKAMAISMMKDCLQEAILDKDGNINVNFSRIEVGPIAAKMAKSIAYSKAIEVFCNVVGAVIDAFLPGLGSVVAFLLNNILGSLLADSVSGSADSDISLTPMRPTRIYDNAGNEINIEYVEAAMPAVSKPGSGEYDFLGESDNYSRIAKLTYLGPKGPQEVRYVYDKNGYLIQVVKPGNAIESYAYTFYYPAPQSGGAPTIPDGLSGKSIAFDWDNAKAAKYDNQGALLTQITSATGAQLSLDYDFVQAKSLQKKITDDDDSKLSSFVVTQRKVTGGPISQTWRYDGYSTFATYTPFVNSHADGELPAAGYFSKITVTDPKGNDSTSQFFEGLPVSEINPIGFSTVTLWDPVLRRPLRKVVDQKGFQIITTYSDYDSFGFPQTITETGTNTPTKITKVEYERSPVYLQTNVLNKPKHSWIEADGKRSQDTTFTYDSAGKGNLVQSVLATDAGPAVTAFQVDPYGNVIRSTDPLGRVTTTQYVNGTLVTQTTVQDVNWVTAKTYLPNSALVDTETDLNGNLTTYAYDDRGRVTFKSTQTGYSTAETRFQYNDDPNNLSLSMQIHTSDGRQDKAIEGKFNPFGKLYQLTVSPKGAESLTTKYTYSPTLEILTVTDPLGRTTRYTYDEIDRLTDVSKPDGSRQSIQYFDNANAKAITDENGNVTTYMYDGRNNLIQVRLPNYRPASYVYGALGNLLSVTDLRGMKTTFSYDSNANLVSTTFPDGTQESNTYDVLGNLLSHTDPNGQTTRYDTYDSQKRPKTVSFSDGTLVNYTYDAGFKGKVSAISVSGPDSQSISYAYDPFGNIIKQTKSLGNETFALEYLYDDSGLLLKQKDPLSGNWQEFSYDSLGRLTQIQFPINGSLRPVVNDIRYNKANLMLGYALPLSNITATQGFDPQNDRIKSITFTGPTYLSYKNQQNAAILQAMNKLNLPQFNQDPTVTGNALPYFTQTYTYDPAGNRTQLTQKEATDTTQFTYDYDRMNQLVAYAMKLNNSDPVEFKYTYDAQGNRTQLMQGTTTLTTDFDTTTNKPNGYWFGTQKNDENHIDFVYDKNGNRTAKQLKTPKNELLLDITYTWNAQNRMTRYTLNGTTQTNRYQFSGPRYEKKETSPEGTETTRFYPDDSLRLLSEKITDAKGQKSYAYIYLGTQKLARISKNVATQKDEVSYFLNDALGTPAWITYEHTASPNAPVLVSQNLRDPWGNEMGSAVFNQTPVRDFTGKQQDTLSNLYDFGFRYYDSLLGTWIGKDLVPADYTAPLSLNEYLYALNSPLRFIDPDGRENLEAAKFARNNLANFKYGNEWGSKNGGVIPVNALFDSKLSQIVCNQFVSLAYQGAGEKDFPWYGKSGKWIPEMQGWFKDHGRYLTGDDVKLKNLEVGDVIFTARRGATIGHVAIIADIRSDGSFSIQGAHSKGTDILNGTNGKPLYFPSIEKFSLWFQQDIIGIGQQVK
ncbi:MAG: RHS repeat-associated core domain-containing protein [Candidatus Margulisiibacteriota bacterium]